MEATILTKEWCVILNPKAKDGNSLFLWSKVKDEFDANNIEYGLFATESKKHAIEITGEAILEGYRKFIVIGGGGTLNEVLNGIMTQQYCHIDEIYLTVIPTGTHNDFANHYNIPQNPAKWVAQLKNAKVVKHDIAKFTYAYKGMNSEGYAIESMGIGIAASVVKSINDDSMNVVDRNGVVKQIINAGIEFKKNRCRFSYNDTVIERKFFYLNASICAEMGGFRFIPKGVDAKGSLFFTYNKRKMGYRRLLELFYNLLVKKKLDGSHIETGMATSCTIEPIEDRVCYIQADGEFYGHAPTKIWLVPDAINVIVPA